MATMTNSTRTYSPTALSCRPGPRRRRNRSACGWVPTTVEMIVGTFSARQTSSGRIASPVSISRRRRGGNIEIAVTDRGIGIAKEHQERVFERFFRVDKARSRATGGTGLGLAIVKHIAANHNGTIRLWSQPGTGSTFTLSIPAYMDGEEV